MIADLIVSVQWTAVGLRCVGKDRVAWPAGQLYKIRSC